MDGMARFDDVHPASGHTHPILFLVPWFSVGWPTKKKICVEEQAWKEEDYALRRSVHMYSAVW